MDLDDCHRKGFIKKTRVDNELIKSLIEMSGIKENAANSANINEVNISAYVSMAYDSLREVLEALCISKGYKVTSHLCLGELLKTLVDDFDFVSFDRFRYIRNGINYYGVRIDFEPGKKIMKNMFEMRRDVMKKLLKR